MNILRYILYETIDIRHVLRYNKYIIISMEVKMEEKQKKIVGYVFLGILAAMLILVIVGLCTGGVADTGENGTGKITIDLFDDQWEVASKMFGASPTLAIVGCIVAMIGVCVLAAYVALKVFLNKNIRILGILGGLVALAGGILVIVGGIMMALKLNTLGGQSGVNARVYDPAVGTWLAGIGGIAAAIVGFVASSKKFN